MLILKAACEDRGLGERRQIVEREKVEVKEDGEGGGKIGEKTR